MNTAKYSASSASVCSGAALAVLDSLFCALGLAGTEVSAVGLGETGLSEPACSPVRACDASVWGVGSSCDSDFLRQPIIVTAVNTKQIPRKHLAFIIKFSFYRIYRNLNQVFFRQMPAIPTFPAFARAIAGL
jgi:hypothetical protein